MRGSIATGTWASLRSRRSFRTTSGPTPRIPTTTHGTFSFDVANGSAECSPHCRSSTASCAHTQSTALWSWPVMPIRDGDERTLFRPRRPGRQCCATGPTTITGSAACIERIFRTMVRISVPPSVSKMRATYFGSASRPRWTSNRRRRRRGGPRLPSRVSAGTVRCRRHHVAAPARHRYRAALATQPRGTRRSDHRRIRRENAHRLADGGTAPQWPGMSRRVDAFCSSPPAQESPRAPRSTANAGIGRRRGLVRSGR